MALSKEKIRNLKQYSGMSDEEFEQIWVKKYLVSEPSEKFEKRIEEKLEEFDSDYDLSEMKINDVASLRALVQAFISLEDYEQLLFKMRADGVSDASLNMIDKIGKAMSDLRSDISRLQNDLNITRKIRKTDQEASVIEYIDSLKEKARKFVESKMMYVFCPKCNMLLGTLWTLYPTDPRNKLALICNRKLDNGEICGEKVVVSTKELLNLGGSNKITLMPESLI